MVDATNISEGDTPIDFANGIFFTLTGFSIAAMSIYGLRTGNFKLFGAGVASASILIVAIGLLGRNLITSPATPFQAAAGYWGARIIAFIFASGGSFSFYSTASETYFSTALQDAAQWLKVFLNVQIASYIENAAVIGEIVLVFKILQGTGGVNNIPYVNLPEPLLTVVHLGIAILVGAATFARLHGLRGGEFMIRAGVLMAIMAGLLIAEDQGLFSIPLFPITFSAMYGLHSGININEAGGLFVYYSTIAAAQPPVSYIVQAVYLVDGLMAVVAVYGTYRRIMG